MGSLLLISVALALSTFSLLSQPTSRDEGLELGGQVQSIAREALRNAEVVLISASTGGRVLQTVKADLNGTYRFAGVDPGLYRLYATHPAYLRAEYGARSPMGKGKVVSVAKSSQHLLSLDFQLTPLARVTVRVMDELGDPKSGVRVYLLRTEIARGAKRSTIQGIGVTTSDGEYRFSDVPPGTYSLRAAPMELIRPGATPKGAEMKTERESYITTDYAMPTRVDGGDDLHLHIELLKHRTFSASGRIRGESVPDSTFVMAIPAGTPDPEVFQSISGMAAVAKEERTFHLASLPSGEYLLLVGIGQKLLGRASMIIVQEDVVDIEIDLLPPCDIKGLIKIDQGSFQEIANASITMKPELPTASVHARVNDNLSFQFSNLSREKFLIEISTLPEDIAIKEVRFHDGGRVSGMQVDCRSGGVYELILNLTRANRTISGIVFVESTHPAAEALVVAVPTDIDIEQRKHITVITDENGRFKFDHMMAGRYRIFALETDDISSWPDEAVHKLASRATMVDLTAAEYAEVQLQRIGATTQSGETYP
ncbi:MAG: carboxypeptidase regulatory-like domain-containing protein [Bryobacterales bacterium]|nr:carboxypeptidase regulatory-like domain-containing protein [Bryobacterales bacterium]